MDSLVKIKVILGKIHFDSKPVIKWINHDLVKLRMCLSFTRESGHLQFKHVNGKTMYLN